MPVAHFSFFSGDKRAVWRQSLPNSASANFRCIRYDRTNNRCPPSSLQPHTACCSICPPSFGMSKQDARTSQGSLRSYFLQVHIKIRVVMVVTRERSCCPQKNTFPGTPLAGLLLYAGLLVSVELFPASRSTSLLGTGVRCSELDMLRVKQLLRYS